MIASLRGKTKAVLDHAIILDVGGVGFLVRVPRSVLDQFSAVGQAIELTTHLIVRETEMTLYGFVSEEEKELFITLLGVTGVGPRTALGVLSAFSPETLRHAVSQGDVLALSRVPGVGRKTAQRLVMDLKDKLGPAEGVWLGEMAQPVDGDVLSALTALGYSVLEAQTAIRALPEEAQTLDERILAALRVLGGQ